jgi:hypothetical protein
MEDSFSHIVVFGIEMLKAIGDEPAVRNIVDWWQVIQCKGQYFDAFTSAILDVFWGCIV